MLSDNLKFFNKKSLFYTLIIIFLIMPSDLYIYFSDAENALSISFYIKLAVCIIYLLAVKNEGYSQRVSDSLESAFHILLAFCGVMLAIINYLMFSDPPSKFVGVFLVFGLFGLFNVISELGRCFYNSNNGSNVMFRIVHIVLKVLFFMISFASVLFLIAGGWRWDVKPFYEW